MNKKIISLVLLVIAGGALFYGGMKYDQSKKTASRGASNFANLSPEERQARATAGGFAGMGRGGRAGGGTGFITGEVISKDDKSVTIKLNDGGSKIVFLSESTEITKSASGSINDLEVGKNISVNGVANSDGSVTAQTIQLRPANRNQ